MSSPSISTRTSPTPDLQIAAPRHGDAAPWSIRPLVRGPWQTLNVADTCALVARLSCVEINNGQAPSAATVRYRRARAVPMRPFARWFLIEVEAELPDGSVGYLPLLYGPDRRVALTQWDSVRIRRAWQESPPSLRDSPAIFAYLRLHTGLAADAEGRMAIVETVEDLHVTGGSDPHVEAMAAGAIQPMQVVSHSPREVRVSASVRHGSTLYRGDLSVDEDGLVLCSLPESQRIASLPLVRERTYGCFRVIEE